MDTRLEKILLHVQNMTCTKCVNLVSKALNLLDGVDNFKVRLKFKTITVEYDKSVVSLEDIISTLKEKGYNATVMK